MAPHPPIRCGVAVGYTFRGHGSAQNAVVGFSVVPAAVRLDRPWKTAGNREWGRHPQLRAVCKGTQDSLRHGKAARLHFALPCCRDVESNQSRMPPLGCDYPISATADDDSVPGTTSIRTASPTCHPISFCGRQLEARSPTLLAQPVGLKQCKDEGDDKHGAALKSVRDQ